MVLGTYTYLPTYLAYYLHSAYLSSYLLTFPQNYHPAGLGFKLGVKLQSQLHVLSTFCSHPWEFVVFHHKGEFP